MASRCKRVAAVCDILDLHDLAAALAAGAPFKRRRRLLSSTDEGCDEDGGAVVAVEARCPSSSSAGEAALREAEFFAVCGGHPSVVALRALAVDPASGDLSLVMERAGATLHNVLYGGRRYGRQLPESDVRRVMRRLLEGAEHMHANRVVHRNIKPSNILVGDENDLGDIKIGGLGFAVSLLDPPPYGRVGTRRYMAPEVLLGKPDYDTKADAWSLGCVMAELLAGEPLFDGDDDADQIHQIFHVLGVPGYMCWPEYETFPLAGKLVTPPRIRHLNRLYKVFPLRVLSEEGVDVLSGLLCCSIRRRMSAAAALRLPWFTGAGDGDRDA